MCEGFLQNARKWINAAYGAFAAIPVLIGIAIALNGGFFTAPGAPIPMAAAAVAAFAAGAFLKQAFDALQGFELNGCLSQTCHGAYYNIRNALAASMTTVGIIGASCAAVAAVAWIPWVTQPGMWVVFGAVLTALASLATLEITWGPLKSCQDKVGKSRGALQPGEKASDPWFLRLEPVHSKGYALPVDATLIRDDHINTRWIRCAEMRVAEWRVEAVAKIGFGTAKGAKFTWSLDGKAIDPKLASSGGTQSILNATFGSGAEVAELRVTAVDSSGFTRSKTAELYLGERQISCTVEMPWVPPELRSPILPGPEVIFEPTVDFARERIRTVAEAERPGGGDLPSGGGIQRPR